MAATRRIPLQAVVGREEQDPVRRAVERLAEALGGWPLDWQFGDFPTLPDRTGERSILVTSLFDELDRLDDPWPDVERRVVDRYSRLGRVKGLTVYVLTIFRHIGPGHTPEQATRLRVRIRRLNLLAVELSRLAGVLVIDVDRALADLGGLALQTDYRLAGDAAIEAAADCVAATLLATALDSFVPIEVQDAAAARLAATRTAGEMETVTVSGDTIVAIGSGRRIQHAQIAGRLESQAAFLLRQLVSGRLSPRAAAARLAGAVSRRGLRSSAVIVLAGVGRMLRPDRGAGRP